MKLKSGAEPCKGRPKGSKNRRTLMVEEIAARFDIDPFEVLMMVAAGDWKGLGYKSECRTSFAASGIEFEEPVIKLADRVNAAKEASKYLYSQKQAVQIDLKQLHRMTDIEFDTFKNEQIEAYLDAHKKVGMDGN